MLGDYGGGDTTFSSLWEALPTVAVVGGQVSSSVFYFSLLETGLRLSCDRTIIEE